MTQKRFSPVFAVSLVLLAVAEVFAAPPWQKLLTVQRVEADPAKDYSLTEENGPWMIMACSFSGDGAEQQAKDLVLELRRRYKLPSYTYQMEVKLGETVGRGVDRFGNPIKMKYSRGSEIKEIGVLVGNFPAVDEPEAQEILKKLKYYQPECLEIKDGKKTNRTLAGWRMLQQQIHAPESDQKKKGPIGHTFVTTNPKLPKEYFAPKGIDRFVVKMNEGVEHSLLDCPGKYTVQVAHFTGSVVIDQAEIRPIAKGKEMKSQLAEAADRAHRLCVALRKKGHEAYEFHDRSASLVTVGSFDSVGAPRPDGKIEINPQIHALMKTFGPDENLAAGQSAGAVRVKAFDGIPLDVQPLPVEVPRRSVAADYRREPARR